MNTKIIAHAAIGLGAASLVLQSTKMLPRIPRPYLKRNITTSSYRKFVPK